MPSEPALLALEQSNLLIDKGFNIIPNRVWGIPPKKKRPPPPEELGQEQGRVRGATGGRASAGGGSGFEDDGNNNRRNDYYDDQNTTNWPYASNHATDGHGPTDYYSNAEHGAARPAAAIGYYDEHLSRPRTYDRDYDSGYGNTDRARARASSEPRGRRSRRERHSRSRSSSRDRKIFSKKELGSSALGAVAGGIAGQAFGDKKNSFASTLIGGIIGALGANALETRLDRDRSQSRSRSRSRRRRNRYDDDNYNDDYDYGRRSRRH